MSTKKLVDLVRHGKTEDARYLVESWESPDKKDLHMGLYFSIQESNIELVAFFAGRLGAEVKKVGHRYLYHAVKRRCKETIDILLDAGAELAPPGFCLAGYSSLSDDDDAEQKLCEWITSETEGGRPKDDSDADSADSDDSDDSDESDSASASDSVSDSGSDSSGSDLFSNRGGQYYKKDGVDSDDEDFMEGRYARPVCGRDSLSNYKRAAFNHADDIYINAIRCGSSRLVIMAVEKGIPMTDNITQILDKRTKKGKLDVLIFLVLECGFNIQSAPNSHLYIVKAASHGNLELFTALYEQKLPVSATLFRHACMGRNRSIIKMLIDGDEEGRRLDYDECLMSAVSLRKKDVVEMLLAKGADPFGEYCDPLFEAMSDKSIEIYRTMLDWKREYADDADRERHMESLNHMLVRAAEYAADKIYVELLLKKGADVHSWDDMAIKMSIKDGVPEVIETLLRAGANPDAGNGEIMRWALQQRNMPIIGMLIRYGAPFSWDIFAEHSEHINSCDIVARADYPMQMVRDREFFLNNQRLLRAKMVINWDFTWYAKRYLYSPWSRWATESLEILPVEGEDETVERARKKLHRKRNRLINWLIGMPHLTQDVLIERYSSVEWGDDRDGKRTRSLIGEGRTRPSRRQMICRLPTSVMEELVVSGDDE